MVRGLPASEQQRKRNAAAGRAPKDGQARARTADNATLEEQCHPRKIFVGGLPHKTTTQQLREHFSQFGVIVDAVVLRWPDGRSRGFGYITFMTASSAAAVLSQTHRIGGRQIDTKRAVPGTNKLFVGGLPQNCAATELREHFEAFGVVSDAVVMIDPATNRSRGFGFVCFLPGQEGAASVTSALEHYNNHRIRGKWIEVKSAVSPHKLATNDSSPSQEKDSPCTSTTASEAPSPAQQPQPVPEVVAPLPAPATAPKGLFFLAPPPGLVEPRKVALPTTTTTMAAALAAVNNPEALAAARRTKYTPSATSCEPAVVMPRANACEPALLPHRLPQPASVSGSPPAAWSMFRTPEEEPVKIGGLSGSEGSLASSLGRVSLFNDSQPGAFTTSESLQRSLEQLLRQRFAAEEPKVPGQEREPVVVTQATQ